MDRAPGTLKKPGPQAPIKTPGKKAGKGVMARRVVQQAGRNPTKNVAPIVEGSGRQSGRLREKGTTTYTTNGEIFRGGKRVNEDRYTGM